MAELLSIPVAQLQLAAYNPRKTFDDASIAELAQSMKSQGQLQPVLVRLLTPAKGKKAATYEVVCGARRTKAAQVAGLPEVLCNVAELNDDQAFEAAVTENLQREDVKPMEEARAFAALIERGYTLQQLGERFGKSHVHIWNRVQLAKATPELQEAIEAGEIPLTYARVLAKFPEHIQVQQIKDTQSRQFRSPESYQSWLLSRGHELSNAPFRFMQAGCLFCEFNATQRKLGNEPICLNSEKYYEKVRAYVLKLLARDDSAEKTRYKLVAEDWQIKEAKEFWKGILPENVRIEAVGWGLPYRILEEPNKPVMSKVNRPNGITEEGYLALLKGAEDNYLLDLEEYNKELEKYKQGKRKNMRAIRMYGPKIGNIVYLEADERHGGLTYSLDEFGKDDNAAARAEITKEIMELAQQIERNPVLASEKAYEVAREQINDLAMYKGIDSIDDQPALLDEEMDALYLHMVTERISFFPDNVRRAIMGKSYETFRFTPKQIEAALAVKQQLWPLAVRMFLKQAFQHVNGSSCSTQERYAWDKIAMALPDVDYSEVAKVHDGYAAKLKKLQDRHAELVASLEKLQEVAQ